MVRDAGIDPALVSFAGPGKRDSELELAIAAGATLNCESEGEVARAIAIGERLGITPRLAIRVNPDFELRGSGMKMGGGAKPFGVDAERVPALAKLLISQGAEWQGLHIFTGSQALDPSKGVIPSFNGPNAYKPPKSLIPDIYSSPEKTPLKYTVRTGENDFTIELKD